MNEELLVDSEKDKISELTLNDLAKSGKYNIDLIELLKKGDFGSITLYTSESEREDNMLMEPLLYAVKHDLGTFEVFKYCNERLQRDVAREVIKEEPELIAETPLCRDAKFIMKNARYAPQIIQYADDRILEDEFVVYSLCLVSTRVAAEVLKATNVNVRAIMGNEIQEVYGKNGNFKLPKLSDDRDFVSAAIQEKGVEFLKYAGEEIKNDYEFLKEQALKEPKIIDFVVDNIQEFGKEGINAAKDASKDLTVQDFMKLENDDPVLQSLKKSLENDEKYDQTSINLIACFYARDNVEFSPQTLTNIINYSLLNIEACKRRIEENGIDEVKREDFLAIPPPHILNKLKAKLELQGVRIDEKTNQRIEDCISFYNETKEKYDQKRKEMLEERLQQFDTEMTKEDLITLIKEDAGTALFLSSAYLKLDNPNPETLIRIMDCYLETKDELKRQVDENGFILGEIDGRGLITPLVLEKITDLLEKNGIPLDENTKNRINEYNDFYIKCRDYRKEQNLKKSNELLSQIGGKAIDNSPESLYEQFNNQLNYALSKMEELSIRTDANGKMIVDRTGASYLMNSSKLLKLKESLEESGILLSSDLLEKLNTYCEFVDNYKIAVHESRSQFSISFEDINALREFRDKSQDSIINSTLENLEENEDNSEGFKLFKKRIDRFGKRDPRITVQIVSYMATKDLNIKPEDLKNIINYSLLNMQTIRREIIESGNNKLNREQMAALITPYVLNKLKTKLENQGVSIDDETQEAIDTYTDFYNNTRSKYKEQKLERIANYKNKFENGEIKLEDMQNNDNLDNSAMNAALAIYLKNNNSDPEVIKTTIMANFKFADVVKENFDKGHWRRHSLGLIIPSFIDNILEQLKDKGIEFDEEFLNQFEKYKEVYGYIRNMQLKVHQKNIKRAEMQSKLISEKPNNEIGETTTEETHLVSLEDINSVISEQRISDIKNGEQRLVENIQETIRENSENQYINSTDTTNPTTNGQHIDGNEETLPDDVR